MNYPHSQSQDSRKVAHTGHAPPKFRSPTTTSIIPSIPTLSSSSIRRALPPAPREKTSSSGLSASRDNHIKANLRKFEHHIPLKHDIKYIYAVNPSLPNTVYFFEYRGPSAPLAGLGASGDVYVDTTIGSYALYAKIGAGWIQWTGHAGLQHPFLTDTILWVSSSNVEWVHPTDIEK